MDFHRPNVEIGWKMANDQLLFLALYLQLMIQATIIEAKKFAAWSIINF